MLEGYKVADAIKRSAVGTSSFRDWWAYKLEVYDAIPENGAILHEAGLEAEGEIGDERTLRAIEAGIKAFEPDRLVIATLPASASVWQRFEVVDRARTMGVPVTHIEAASLVAPV